MVVEKTTEAQDMVLLTSNAFAPTPDFSFDAQAVMAFLSLGGERARFEPEFSVGLNGWPWMWDNWLRYSFVNRPLFKLSAGVNPNLLVVSAKIENKENLIEVHRSITGEVTATLQHARSPKYMLVYRYNQAFDFGTVSGHSIDFSAELQQVFNYKEMYVNLHPQLFYFNAEDDSNGFLQVA